MLMCIVANVCAQITKERKEQSDGTVWYETHDKNSSDYQNYNGVQIHGEQIVPNSFLTIFYGGEYNGIHFFRGAKYIKSGEYPESLYNCDGVEIVSYKRGYEHFRHLRSDNKDHILFHFQKDGKYGVIDGRTGNILLEPRYEQVYSYSNGNFNVEQNGEDMDIYVSASNLSTGTTRRSRSSSSSASNNASSTSSSSASRSECWVCNGRGVIYMSFPFTGQMPCGTCGGSGIVNFNSGNSQYNSYDQGVSTYGGSTYGGGTSGNGSHQCRVCNGTGSEIYEPYTGSGREVYCDICKKTFYHAHSHRTCKTCGGSGRISN